MMTAKEEVIKMTKEEAIKLLVNATYSDEWQGNEDLTTANNMAIEALETLEEFERAQIITGGRLNGRTYAYKCGLEDGKCKALEQEPIWTPVREGLPKVNGKYLVTVRGLIDEDENVEILKYANDLYKIDDYDFHNKKGIPGWYIFYERDGCFIDVDDVIAWAPLPKPYKEKN